MMAEVEVMVEEVEVMITMMEVVEVVASLAQNNVLDLMGYSIIALLPKVMALQKRVFAIVLEEQNLVADNNIVVLKLVDHGLLI